MDNNNFSNSQPTAKNLAMTYGLGTGLVLIVLSLIVQFTKMNENTWVQYGILAVYIAAVIAFCIVYAKQQNGNVTYGSVFGKGFRMVALVAIIMLAWVLLSTYLFPEIKEQAIEKAREKMETDGMDEETMETALAFTKNSFTLLLVAGTIFSYVIVGLIASAIGAAFAKKNTNQTPFQP